MLSQRIVFGLAVAACAAVLVTPLGAQYFGQNKVRYRSYDFKVLNTEHFDIYFYPEEEQTAKFAGRMAERWYARLSKLMQHELPPHQAVILYDSPAAFRGTTVIPGEIGESTGGVTEALRRRVVIPSAGALGETDHVLGHELVHAFQYHMVEPNPGSGYGGGSGLEALPLWFVEGMAEFLSLGPQDPLTTLWMRDAIVHDKLPKVKDLENPKYFPYRWGQSLLAYIAGKYGEESIRRLLLAGGRSGNIKSALESVLQINEDQLTKDWHQALRDQYKDVIAQSDPVAKVAEPVESKKHGGGTLHVSPSISPDGKYLAFFSEKGLFSIDLYLADAKTGEIIRKITDTATNPHFDAFEFVNSSGSWSADSKRFAFASLSSGRAQLSIYDVDKRDVVQQIKFDQFGEILYSAFSPDGNRVAFAASTGGLLDLYAVDLRTKKLDRLTNDAFAEMMPSWSPDGKKIAFVTDRFDTNLDTLSYGNYRIAVMDVETREVAPGPHFPQGKHIDPHWTADGSGLYFISDQDGVPNIYVAAMGDSSPRRLTKLQTGVTGISNSSPALSVAGTGQMIFSVLEDGDYNLYAMNAEQARVAPPSFDRTSAAWLPPVDQSNRQVEGLIAESKLGQVSDRSFKITDYHPKFSLSAVSPLNIGVGSTSFGTVVGGGLALYFSDLLEQHNILTGIETSSIVDGNFLRNLAATVGYQNQKGRWTWGVSASQIPYVTGNIVQGTTTVNGQAALFEQSVTEWQIDRQFGVSASYPFNRAQRFEISGGYDNIGFVAQANTTAVSAFTGDLLIDRTQDLPTPDALHLGSLAAALVYDTSIFGGTSPVRGMSYRFELGGNTGSLTYSTGLADFRRYFMLARPLTLAGRLLHYGRYGGGAEDSRLQALFLGYPTLVRGYDPNSFSAAECGTQLSTNGTCPVFDQLFGSKIGVGNAELRLQLLGPLGLVRTNQIPPVEVGPFYDAGFAWSSDAFTAALGVPRTPVSSWGLTGRVNVLGFAVFQTSFVHPEDRPGKKWMWEFGLVSGF